MVTAWIIGWLIPILITGLATLDHSHSKSQFLQHEFYSKLFLSGCFKTFIRDGAQLAKLVKAIFRPWNSYCIQVKILRKCTELEKQIHEYMCIAGLLYIVLLVVC